MKTAQACEPKKGVKIGALFAQYVGILAIALFTIDGHHGVQAVFEER